MNRLSNMLAVALLGPVLLTSCAKQRMIDRDELRSDLTAGISLGSESRLYLQQTVEGRTSQSFSEGHLHYLAEEANRTERELQQSVASSEDVQTLNQSRLQFEALSWELTTSGQKPSDPKAIVNSIRRLAEIGKAMEKTKSSL